MAQQDVTFENKEDIVAISNRKRQVVAADINELKRVVSENGKDTESRLLNVEDNQSTGVIARRLYADLPVTGDVDVSYKVSNDPTVELNGYYTWTGSAYLKSLELNSGLIREGEIESVTGDRINRAIIKKSIGKNIFNKNDGGVIVGSFMDASGALSPNASYSTTGYVPVLAGIQYVKSQHATTTYTAYYEEDFSLIGTTNSANITPPTSTAYMRTSYLSADIETFQIEIGATSTEYASYTEFYQQIGEEDIKDGSISENKIQDSAVSVEKTTFIYDNPENLYNSADTDVVTGFILDANGAPTSPNAAYRTTGFIRVNEGDVIYGGNDGLQVNMRFLYSYDSNKDHVGGSEDAGRTSFTVPAGVMYIRVSFTYIDYPLYQIQKGGITSYVAYSENIVIDDKYLPEITKIKDGAVTEPKIADSAVTGSKVAGNAITTSKIVDGAVTEAKTPFFNASINLFNPNDPTVALGSYIGYDNGVEIANAAYNSTGFIPVSSGSYYTLSFKHQIAWYDANMDYVSGSNSTDTNKTQLAPAGVSYLRCSVILSFWDEFQVEIGQTESPYVPYGFTLKEEYIAGLDVAKYETQLGNEGKLITQASLTSGSIIEITDFPYHLKKGLSMSMYVDLPSGLSSDISYGCGFNKYRGTYFFIGATDISYYYDGVFQDTKAHGLNIATFLKSSFFIDDYGIAYVIVQSIDGTFMSDFTTNYECNYEPFIRTNGQTVSNIKLTCTSKEFRHPVWFMGDSYFGVAADRWPGVMKDFGFFNFLINGLAGQVSQNALIDLNRCLNYGTPKYIVWCLGMNDDDTNYTNTLNSLIAICDTNNITLILSTIPTVPTRDKEVIKATVEGAGYRYIDFYKAVGTDASGNWYSGYLNGDGVHPNVIGAQALATQILTDFPEIMQYGKTF